MLSVVYPRSLVILFKRIVIYYLRFALILMGAHMTFTIFKLEIFGWQYCDGIKLTNGIAALTISAFCVSIVTYVKNIISAAYIFIVEHKRIEYIPLIKKFWYCITFPIFDIIGRFSLLIALFKKVEWKAIPHTSSVKIEDIKKGASLKENHTTKT